MDLVRKIPIKQKIYKTNSMKFATIAIFCIMITLAITKKQFLKQVKGLPKVGEYKRIIDWKNENTDINFQGVLVVPESSQFATRTLLRQFLVSPAMPRSAMMDRWSSWRFLLDMSLLEQSIKCAFGRWLHFWKLTWI